jgi:hypothetical protein
MDCGIGVTFSKRKRVAIKTTPFSAEHPINILQVSFRGTNNCILIQAPKNVNLSSFNSNLNVLRIFFAK